MKVKGSKEHNLAFHAGRQADTRKTERVALLIYCGLKLIYLSEEYK